MDFLNSHVRQEYERWKKTIGDEPYNTQNATGIHDVLRAHFLIVDYFSDENRGIGGVGPRNLNLLHSAISRQFVTFAHTEKWPDPIQKCATLLYGLVKDHPFHDANKRTAFLTTLYRMQDLGRTPKISHTDFENFIVAIAENKLPEYSRYEKFEKKSDPEIFFISDFLRSNTREVDQRPQTITFHELNHILKRYGYELENPQNNYIDIVKYEIGNKIFGFGGETKKRRITRVGFPGWKNQVNHSALKFIREQTGLTYENGYDSSVIFRGADPINSLIAIYEEPLKRLAYR